MDESRYIFEQSETTYYIANTFAIALIILASYNIFKVLKKGRYFYNSSGEKSDRTVLIVGAVMFGGLILFTTPRFIDPWRRIKKYHKETVGTTIKKLTGRKTVLVQYRFFVENKLYIAECGIVYGGFEIPNIQIPGGHYKVIYNSKDPNESVMDFKMPEP